jgi:hypothetical protein
MFCPKCGDQLERRENELTCLRGEMALSPLMETGLDAAFVSRTVVPGDDPLPFQVGGNWFCPGDAERMIEVGGVIRCPTCERSLNHFVSQLVERHPHDPSRA